MQEIDNMCIQNVDNCKNSLYRHLRANVTKKQICQRTKFTTYC